LAHASFVSLAVLPTVLSCGIATLVIALRGFTCLSMFSSDAAKVRLG